MSAQTTLKDAYHGYFLIGTALNQAQFEEKDAGATALITAQFNSISPENVLKWESVHPRPTGFDFKAADEYVAFGEKRKMFVIGHNLIWHNQTPQWVFQDADGKPSSRDALLARMREHIATVVGRYKGRIGGWDVVNEALNEDGTLRQSPWLKGIGDDYLAKAFQFANEADPAAELYYNDYSLENPAKRRGAVALIKKLQAQGVPVTGIGLQEHDRMDWPAPAEVDATIKEFAGLGLKVMITELDVSVLPSATQSAGAEVTQHAELQARLNPYTNGLPDSVQQKLAQRYADLFSVFLKNRASITRVTFWGVSDHDSWLNYWPVRGRTDYQLLFDRDNKPKAAFGAVISTAGAPNR